MHVLALILLCFISCMHVLAVILLSFMICMHVVTVILLGMHGVATENIFIF